MGLVYHYTSPEGALGILKNRTLWFTDCEFMNDPAELKYCHDLYNRAWVEVCRERGMSEAQIGREITKHANPYMCESIASEAVGAYVPARYYVLSTCLNGNDPAMWANYANKEGKVGYSLEFDRDKLIQMLEELVSESSKFGIYAKSYTIRSATTKRNSSRTSSRRLESTYTSLMEHCQAVRTNLTAL